MYSALFCTLFLAGGGGGSVPSVVYLDGVDQGGPEVAAQRAVGERQDHPLIGEEAPG